MKLTVNVMKKHIMKGVQSNANMCAIAKALRATGARDVNVDCGEAHFKLKGVRYSTPMPERAARFIDKFDGTYGSKKNRSKLKPFSFTLRWKENE